MMNERPKLIRRVAKGHNVYRMPNGTYAYCKSHDLDNPLYVSDDVDECVKHIRQHGDYKHPERNDTTLMTLLPFLDPKATICVHSDESGNDFTYTAKVALEMLEEDPNGYGSIFNNLKVIGVKTKGDKLWIKTKLLG